MKARYRLLVIVLLVIAAISNCRSPGNSQIIDKLPATPSSSEQGIETAAPEPTPAERDPIADARRSLASLKKVDDYPLYTMTYYGDYRQPAERTESWLPDIIPSATRAWSCSLFAALGDPANGLFGRNFDWGYSPALVLFTDPPDGYSSVSMVDLTYLVDNRDFQRLTEMPLDDRKALLEAPWLPFDGMNEAGVAIGMAAVPAGHASPDPDKETIGSIQVVREVLDYAGNVAEAKTIFQKYNLEWGSAPTMHYLVADRTGQAVLIEDSGEEQVMIPNQDPWHLATNFLVDQAGDNPEGRCWRYKRISSRLAEVEGRLSVAESIVLLSQVSQNNQSASTQWSVVYSLHTGEMQLVLGRQYTESHSFSLFSDR